MPDLAAVAILAVVMVLPWLVARRMVAPPAAAAPSIASGARMLAASAVGVMLAAVSTVLADSLYWAAAGVAGMAVGAATAMRLEVDRISGRGGYRIPSLRRAAPGAAGAMTAGGAAAAAATILVAVFAAFRLRLLGPSDPGLVALGAYLGVLLAGALEGNGTRRSHRFTDALAGGIGAAIAAALVILLP